MEVKVSTRGRKGPLSKSIRVYSDDPANPITRLTLKGKVEVILGLEKTFLRLNNLEIGKTEESTIPIIAKDSKGLEFGEVETGNPDTVASVSWKKDAKGQRTAVLTVKVTPTKNGRLSRSVKIKTNREKPKELVLRISGEVRGDLQAQPTSITFYSRDGEPMKERFITLSSKKNPFKVLEAKDPKGKLKAKVETLEKTKRYKISVTPPAKVSEPFSTKVKIETNHPDQPSIDIPVHIRFPSQHSTPTKKPSGIHKK